MFAAEALRAQQVAQAAQGVITWLVQAHLVPMKRCIQVKFETISIPIKEKSVFSNCLGA